jgi:hypothetical protein
VESFKFLPPDPRLDHDLIRVRVSCDTLGPMPPLEKLRVPERLRMRNWSGKRTECQEEVSRPLTLSAPDSEADRFLRAR